MDQPVLAAWAPRTKLARPPLAPDVVLDAALVERVVRLASSQPLTLIVAAAGSGKTTLAAAAADRLDRVAWLRLEDLDDEPVAVLELLVDAVGPVVAGGCPAAHALLARGLPPTVDPRRAAALLVNDLARQDAEPLVVVLDDLHVLRAPGTLAVLDYLLDHLPASVHVLATARTEPGLALGRLRAGGRLGEVGADDLRLDAERASVLLNDRLGLELGPEEIDRLVAASSGWVTGVRLLGRAPDALGGFLDEELLGREPDEVRRFLVDTAVLDVLTPVACAALTGRDDAAVVLADLARRHTLFVQPVETDAPSYRYHDLLRSHLLRGLATREPVRLAMLHQAAADIAIAPAARIEHLLAAEAWDDAADAIEAVSDYFARPGDVQHVASWARRLPEATRVGRLRLRVMDGLAAAQRGDVGVAVRALDPIADQLEDVDPTGHWLATRTLHVATYDHARFLPVLGRLEQAPVFAALPAGARADHHLASAYGALFTGAWDEAGRRLRAAVSTATSSGDVAAAEVLAQHVSPLLAAAPGAMACVASYASWAATHFGDPSPLVALGVRHQRAFVHLLRADFAAAMGEVHAVGELDELLGGFPYLRATFDWVRVSDATVRGDLTTAGRMLRDAIGVAEATDLDRGLDLQRLGLLARVLRLQQRVDELREVVARVEAEASSTQQPHGDWSAASAAAQLLWATGDLAGAAETLRGALPVEARSRIAPFLVSLRVDLALVLAEQGHLADAVATLADATASFAAWGTPGLLALAGTDVLPLARRLPAGATIVAAVRALDAGGLPAPLALPGSDVELSGREVQVLRLLAEGASNQAIATSLVVSVNTVKTHVRNVLTKLGAASRGEAVAAARRHHLV